MTPWVTRLVVANVAMFVLSLAAPALVNSLMFVPALALERPWTLVTYMFLHGGALHLLFNMAGLYFFGPRLELEMGGTDFLLLYVVSGVTGALLSFVTPFSAIVGASGAVYGVLIGFARFWPREPIYVWGLLPIEARWMVVIMTGLSLLGGFGAGGSDIAHFAHLGGFLGGWLYLRWRDRAGRAARTRAAAGLPPPGAADIDRWRSVDRASLHEVNREEYDRIMTLLERGGAAALTPQERAFLDRFSVRS